jgi:hypothetical protein
MNHRHWGPLWRGRARGRQSTSTFTDVESASAADGDGGYVTDINRTTTDVTLTYDPCGVLT